MIKYENKKLRYFDKNGKEILENCFVRFSNGRVQKIYLTKNDELGIDATNPKWIESGRAVPCEYGIYPLEENDTNDCEII